MAAFLDEILLHIFGYLDGPTLAKTSLVCKQWRNIAKTPSLWRRLVLLRWPSQRFLYEKASLSHINWNNIYQDLTLRGNFSPDEMKYFICCRVSGDELTEIELRENMFFHMAETMMKWAIPDTFEQEDEFNTPGFNKNFELFFDTHDLKWTFIDKRREYIDDLFSCKMKTTTPARFIRPYQVIPSCLVMFRWLCLFRAYVTEETGLTFYRIWRYRLKHRATGMNFDVYDWKAAMSCTLSNGSPTCTSFREDALELLTILTHPHFLMHPMGVSIGKELHFSLPKRLSSRCNSATSSLSSCGVTSPRSPLRSKGNFSFDQKDTAPKHKIASSTTDSDDESDGGFDTGYIANCEDFISSKHWDVEEQNKIQAEVAGMWTVVNNNDASHLFVNYDVNNNNWIFHDCLLSFPEPWMSGIVAIPGHCDTLTGHGFSIEPIPSCLALYRLVCLMNINARVYASMEDASIWALHLIHNTTRGVLHLKDLNGWFDVSASLTEDMQNQLRESSDKVTGLETLQWCDISTPVPIPDNISDYVASDEDSEAGDEKSDDIWCLTPVQSDEVCLSSSSGSEVDIDDLEEFWFSSLTPQLMGAGETQLHLEDSEIPEGSFVHDSNGLWSSLASPDLSAMPDVEDHTCMAAYGRDLPPSHFDHDSYQGGFDVPEEFRNPQFPDGNSNHVQINSHPSDSDGSDVHSTESAQSSTLKQFKHDVITLLNLLMDEKFAHPYGTIAGSVA
ncbi:uncharacterized protein [Montipora capricornis]|uniref:uncharacterized protein n=1 Tax=Montipora capricornis TaxID=246305 RepID=UPI0035F21C0E